MQIAEARATAAVPEQLLASAAKQVHDITAEIEATADDDGDDAVHVRDFARLKAEIDQIGDKLKAAQGSGASPEELAILRFLTEAGKVCREASPAHPHMAECWLQAASHMRLAVDARATATTGADVQRVDKHRAYCKVYEKLAAGTFRDAASYFAKAARTASPYTRELWREAADLLLQMGVASMRRMDQVATGTETFSSATLAAPTPLETAQSRCVAACAICAKALDGVPKADAAAIVAALRADIRASANVDADSVEGTAEGDNYAVSNVKMLLLIVHVERADLAQAAAVFPTAGAAGTAVLNLLRAVVDGTLLLSRACQLTVLSYPVGHVLYRTAPSADTVQQRDQLLRWLCDAAVDSYKHLHRAFEAQLILNCHEKAMDAILHSVRVAEGVLWFVFPTASGQPTYPVHTYQQAQVYQVLGQRYLAASSMVLADKPLASALLMKATQQVLQQQNVQPLAAAVSNALVRRAWEEPPAPSGALPVELLLPLAVDALSAPTAAKLPELVEAHFQCVVHKVALETNPAMTSQETSLRKKAVESFGYVTQGIVVLLSSTIPRSPAQIQRLEEACARASRCATWCSLAVEALHNGRTDVTALYERATQFAVLSAYHRNKVRELKVDAQAHQAGDKAGTRLAEAAKALAANDLPLYQLWLQAGEATALLVEVTDKKPRGYGQKKLALTAAHSNAALVAADQLEGHAQALQTARQQAQATPTAPGTQPSLTPSGAFDAVASNSTGVQLVEATPAPVQIESERKVTVTVKRERKVQTTVEAEPGAKRRKEK
jgi:hypothetical protein